MRWAGDSAGPRDLDEWRLWCRSPAELFDHSVLPRFDTHADYQQKYCIGDGIEVDRAIGGRSIDFEWVQVRLAGLVRPDDPDVEIKLLASEALRGVGSWNMGVPLTTGQHEARSQAVKKTEKGLDGGSWPAYSSRKLWDEVSGKTGLGRE